MCSPGGRGRGREGGGDETPAMPVTTVFVRLEDLADRKSSFMRVENVVFKKTFVAVCMYRLACEQRAAAQHDVGGECQA